MSSAHQEDNSDLVAVIGVACEFPGATNYTEFWDVLRRGQETITHFTEEELLSAGVKLDRLRRPNYVRSKGIVSCAEHFDHDLFGIEADRAMLMDPQHRVFLQKCWEALEDSGYDPKRFGGTIGLFAGAALNTYVLNNLRHADRSLTRKFNSIEFLMMTDKDFLSTQTSYYLGLRGPSVTVQTACSTSLVAIHYATQSILSAESDIALAGAVTIYCPQVKGYLYESGSIVSSDGHVCSFDSRGTGTVYSSGVGIVVLKSLAKAIRDNDQIYSVIRATAINNDGNRKGGFNMPSVDGIAEVATHALALANVDIDSIVMVEANGSGTAFGDPIEVEALHRAYSSFGARSQSVKIGSVKSNLGHMNVTAGMGAFLKTVASIQHGAIPPTINFETANPNIEFEKTPFAIAAELTPWPEHATPRRAGLNVYGVGGTNGHAVLEEAPERTFTPTESKSHLLLLSAANEKALSDLRSRIESHLVGNSSLDLGNIAFTLNAGRQELPSRCFCTVRGSKASDVRFPIAWNCPTGVAQLGSLVSLEFGNITLGSMRDLSREIEQNSVFGSAIRDISVCAPELKDVFASDRELSELPLTLLQSSLMILCLAYSFAKLSVSSGLTLGQIKTSKQPVAAALLSGIISPATACEILRILALSSEADRASNLTSFLSRIGLRSADVPVLSSFEGQLLGSEIQPWVQVFLGTLGCGTIIGSSVMNTLPFLVGEPATNYDGVSLETSSFSDVEERCLARLGIAWTRGALVDLSFYYRENPRYRISMPNYPFAKTRHWVDIPSQSVDSNYDVAL